MSVRGYALVGLLDQASGLAFLEQTCVVPDPAQRLQIWQRACARLRVRPAARQPDVQPLPPSCAAHEAAVRSQPRFAAAYGAVSFVLVEMAQVFAYQPQVVRIKIDPAVGLATPGAAIDPALLNLCLPPTLKTVTPRWRMLGGEELGSISFYCGTDFEFRTLAAGFAPPNPVDATQMVGVVVGMGNGLVHMWRDGGAYYLVNGYHRVANLLRAGHTYPGSTDPRPSDVLRARERLHRAGPRSER